MLYPSSAFVSTSEHPLDDQAYRAACRERLDAAGALVLERFVNAPTITALQEEAETLYGLAYYCEQSHNIYLTEPGAGPDTEDPELAVRLHVSDKGCVPHDQVPDASPLRAVYECPVFREFLQAVLGHSVYPYADPLASINVHFFDEGQQLGWHYDNSSFAVTLLIQSPEGGGAFEYLKDCRDSAAGSEQAERLRGLFAGSVEPQRLSLPAGTLALFRGRDSLHRVTPTRGLRRRVLVSLAFNTEPGVSLSENARMMFFGRLN